MPRIERYWPVAFFAYANSIGVSADGRKWSAQRRLRFASSEYLSQCLERAESARKTTDAPKSDPNRPVVPPFGMSESIRARDPNSPLKNALWNMLGDLTTGLLSERPWRSEDNRPLVSLPGSCSAHSPKGSLNL